MEWYILTMDSKKQTILEFILKNPGVTSSEIHVGLGRASIGAHTRALMDAGMLIRDGNSGWHIASNYVVTAVPKVLSPMDLAAECIRNMVDVNKR